MVLVSAGEYMMDTENGGYWGEAPLHSVYLDNIYIDTFEVTNERYHSCVDEGICIPPTKKSSGFRADYYGNPQYASYPVIYVDWYMAETYCGWRDGSLPTESHWEKASRGIDNRDYPWGNSGYTCDFAWYHSCKLDTTVVGSLEK